MADQRYTPLWYRISGIKPSHPANNKPDVADDQLEESQEDRITLICTLQYIYLHPWMPGHNSQALSQLNTYVTCDLSGQAEEVDENGTPNAKRTSDFPIFEYVV